MTVQSTPVSRLKAGDRIVSFSTGQATLRTVKAIRPVQGRRAVQVVFASKQRSVFAIDARLPVAVS